MSRICIFVMVVMLIGAYLHYSAQFDNAGQPQGFSSASMSPTGGRASVNPIKMDLVAVTP
jgi:hypothetical protein